MDRNKPCGRKRKENEAEVGTVSHTRAKRICLRTFVEARKRNPRAR